MIIKIDECFAKDFEIITDKKLRNRVADKIAAISSAKAITEITNCKKLQNSTVAYRIRIGDYRIGFEFKNNTIILIRFLHRSKIYSFFPQNH